MPQLWQAVGNNLPLLHSNFLLNCAQTRSVFFPCSISYFWPSCGEFTSVTFYKHLNVLNLEYSGLPHTDQGKIPSVFLVILTFSLCFLATNITFNLLHVPLSVSRLQLEIEKTNVHSKPQSQIQQSLLQIFLP